MPKQLKIIPDRCSACRSCEIVCPLANEKEINPSKSRIAVIGFMEKNDQLPYNFPSTCKQCADAPCLSACPVDAIFQTRDKIKKIGIDYKTCIGCGACVRACPFGAMLFDQKKRAPFKCELCDGDPACAAICPTQAIMFVRQKPFYAKVPSLQMKGFSMLRKRNTSNIRKKKVTTGSKSK